ncbi:rhodanese-like domain-containing protein [Nocardia implantans]|uniref:Sulfurtransferase n=1 Tax=Nocardia implantans TaxID=3108168 RepID=A0ABU6ARZ5_9NOCA|nr:MULTISPECIES: rhodanese-like domain-containing protein [unclassified Nocardia]MBF6191699.1 sulfurtransferase [Nocardia beijingensis]MEA3527992.1 rhodanese-like domain-containing protein [Nocardia sp. CDC192]MEB3510256.1 rhodanese-like domain-containing protein [Nocardia sp. CDC186]
MGDVLTSRVVDAEWLRTRLSDPGVVVIEVTNTPGAEPDRNAIAGARTVYWKDLLWHHSRREFPSAQVLIDRLRALGAGAESTVVFAGEPTQFAAYAIWVAAAVGVGGDLRYLDGGLPAWRAAEAAASASAGPIERAADAAGETAAARAAETPEPLPRIAPCHEDIVVGRDEVRAAIGSPVVILDLRSPQEYSGQRVSPLTEPIDHGAERAGRIPGALSLPAQDLLDEQGLLRPVSELRERVAALGIDDADQIIAYCRLSHRAALGWLVFTDLLDDHRVRVYDGSWTEWGSLVGAPIED